ncbi:MAG TPA: RagB/SusD family nutrient uptake outer membrane protein [Longimicrobiaceae bacterium]|nr:RagB/SusD family nutrient uptake outer membrane protein [Longimicrobiaceae bacterium]
MLTQKISLSAALLAGALVLPACDGLFEVSNPGPIPDEELNTIGAMPSLVNGMSADLAFALSEVIQTLSILSDDLYHGGSYTAEGLYNRGVVRPEDVDGDWGDMHRARWVAEDGIRRMKEVMGAEFDRSPLAARAYLYAGFSNRLLGENVCTAVFDRGPGQDHKEHFKRAEGHFSEALRIATAINNTTLRNAALGGRASVRAYQGKWSEAVQDAALVPTSFTYNALYSLNTSRENNDLVFETYSRREYTVFSTQWARVFRDPRVPWDTVKQANGQPQRGQDGRTPFFQQRKYQSLDSDIPLTKGTEMLMLRAEAALRASDIAGATALINQQRAAYGLAALPAPANTDAAWRTLQKERGAVLWLEARRFGDLRRWYAEGLRQFMQEPGDPRLAVWGTRAQCIPVSDEERRTNPNFRNQS